MLFLEFILARLRIGVAPLPELFDELVLFLGSLEFPKDGLLLIGDDVEDVPTEPVRVVVRRRFILEFRFLLGFSGGSGLRTGKQEQETREDSDEKARCGHWGQACRLSQNTAPAHPDGPSRSEASFAERRR